MVGCTVVAVVVMVLGVDVAVKMVVTGIDISHDHSQDSLFPARGTGSSELARLVAQLLMIMDGLVVNNRVSHV